MNIYSMLYLLELKIKNIILTPMKLSPILILLEILVKIVEFVLVIGLVY